MKALVAARRTEGKIGVWILLAFALVGMFLYQISAPSYQNYTARSKTNASPPANSPSEWRASLDLMQKTSEPFGLVLSSASTLTKQELPTVQRSLEDIRKKFEAIPAPSCLDELRYHMLNSMKIAETALGMASMGTGINDEDAVSALKRSNDAIVEARKAIERKPCS